MPTDRLRTCVHHIWQSRGLISSVLLPFAWITGIVVRSRQRRAMNRPLSSFPHPTIVVGNLLVGGTGKTPVVIAIVQHLQQHGWTPGVVSRGYGTRLGDHPRTGQGALEAGLFGDEPALIAQTTGAPISVHPDRSLARKHLARDFPQVDVVVSDDGLQHLLMSRDIEIVVQDDRGIGNGRLLPAGPLREPATKLQEVDFVVHNSQIAVADSGSSEHSRPEVVHLQLKPSFVENLLDRRRLAWTEWQQQFAHLPAAAVAAIGQPQRFFGMLRRASLNLVTEKALPDHDAYRISPFTALAEPVVLITAKDAVKCQRHADPRVWVVHVDAQFSDPTWLDRLVKRLTQVHDDKNDRKH